MNRVVKIAAVVGVAAAVGGAVAWKTGLIGPRNRSDVFDEGPDGGLIIDDYEPDYEAAPASFAEMLDADETDEDLEFDTQVGVDDAVEVDEPEEGPLMADEPADEPISLVTGSHPALEDGSAPEGFPIKGNADSMLYHVPGSQHYDRTIAEVWFATAEDAEAAGYAKPRGPKKAPEAN